MPESASQTVPNGTGPGSVPVQMTLAEAARLVGVSERAIRKRAERGTLRTSSAVRAGKVVAVVDPADLASLFPQVAAEPSLPTPGPSARVAVEEPVQLNLKHAELELARLELAQAREQLANLRGQLEMSAKVEAAAQRAADKLEAKLDAARRETLTLARALGAAEGERERLRLQLEAPRGWLARLLGR